MPVYLDKIQRSEIVYQEHRQRKGEYCFQYEI